MNRLTKIFLGALLGICTAFTCGYLYYYFNPRGGGSIDEFFGLGLILMIPFLQLGAIVNLGWFFLFNHFKKDNYQMGIITSVIILFGLILYAKM